MFEIIDKKRIRKKFKNEDADYAEYCGHIGYGASGMFDDKTQIGLISSHKDDCKKLEKSGYINLKFCNGGDDDWLVVDHERKEFGFFEDNAPCESAMKRCKTLTELWINA